MKRWSRRELMRTGSGAMAGLSLAQVAGAQMPIPRVLVDDQIRLVTTTSVRAWQPGKVFEATFQWEMLNLNVGQPAVDAQPMRGFGACFNELGWTSLMALEEGDRERVMRELFHPAEGARLSECRMPIGANDFSTAAYSYDETDGDFALHDFTIEHDRATLIPYIRAAMRYQPKLRLWASPWTPPSWMKRNHFYAEAKGFAGMKDNGIRPDQVGHEGEDMFLQEPRYFDAYARYFGRFIDAYAREGIPVGMVMPQNEFNSAQNFPSCTWTAEGLRRFVHALGPEMERRGVKIYFGTLERGDSKLLETVMTDREAARFVTGAGVQWAGKNALPEIHKKYPALKLYQSEQECGDGSNAWSYTSYCWQLMKEYFRNGACGYMYWNIALDETGLSTWGWRQNSLVSVDRKAKSYRWNPDYYLLKHLTHFVDAGAVLLQTTGTCDDALAFRNPGGGVIVLLRNETARPQLVQVQAAGNPVALELPADSVGTLELKAAA